jgi:hypothetical protein
MLARLRYQPAMLCRFIFLLTTEWKRVQTNIWQDPYVKSEAVLFLYELDSDAHTAAMMMLQEDQEDMFVAQDAYRRIQTETKRWIGKSWRMWSVT